MSFMLFKGFFDEFDGTVLAAHGANFWEFRAALFSELF